MKTKLDGIYSVIKNSIAKPRNRKRLKFLAVLIALVVFSLIFAPTIKIYASEKSGTAEEIVGALPKTEPDFSKDELLSVKGLSENLIAARFSRESEEGLWLFDLDSETSRGLYLGRLDSENHLGYKENTVFWFSAEKQTIFGYKLSDNLYFRKLVPVFDSAKAQRVEVGISDIPWKIIVTSDNLYFSTRKTGEIFSDGNSEVLEKFRQTYRLDELLSAEKIEDLGFYR